MADEATSADPEALGNYVDTGAKLRGELAERVAELDALVRWVESGSPDFAVPGMGSLVDRLAALGVQWERTEASVAAVREALVGADVFGGGMPFAPGATAGPFDRGQGPVAEVLAAQLVDSGLTETLAAAIAAETMRLVATDPSLTVYKALRRASAEATGVSEDELERRGRALGLSRARAVATLGQHWDAAERASGDYGHGVTLAGLRAVADDERAPEGLRDAAYRLASDPGLFNDLDSAARTKGVTASGYDWSQADGLIGRSDLDGFGVRDGQRRVVLPWRLLIDSAADGFQVGRADGVIRGRELERFVHDRRIPAVVRQAAWELYAATDPDLVRDLDPFEPSDEELDDNGLLQAAARGFGVVGPAAAGRSSWLATGKRPPWMDPAVAEPLPVARYQLSFRPAGAPGGAGGPGFAGLMAAVVAAAAEPVVDAGVDRAVAAWDRARSTGMPSSFVVFDPRTGQAIEVPADALAGLSGDSAVAAVFWAAATGQPPASSSELPIPDRTWVDENGVWRDGVTNRPLAGLGTGSDGEIERKPLRDPYQYEDFNGDLRWADTTELVSQRPNRSWYEDDDGAWRWGDTDELVEPPFSDQVPPRPLTSDEIGALREITVARLVGGTVLGEPGKPGMEIIKPNVGKTDVDVLGPNGEYIVVGGPAKSLKLSRLGEALHILRFVR